MLFLIVGFSLTSVAYAESRDEVLRDLHFDEALFFARQGLHFDALQRLDTELAQHASVDEPELDSLYRFVPEAEFSVGDFELSYRMHHRAGRAITAVLEGNVETSVRNEAALRLARIHFQKAQYEDALLALDRIEGRLSEPFENELEYLRANVLLSLGRATEAAQVLRRIQGAEELAGFAAYNLAIAWLQDGRRSDALQQLSRAGVLKADEEAGYSIRDKANLVQGTLLMEDNAFEEARLAFDRVRLEGPLSNQALLSSGWASATDGNFERALVPWGVLAERERTDAAVQEARLALPYAYAQLGVYGRAALLYGDALESFDTEVRRLEQSIDSIREGRFLEALIREEIRQDEDWVIRLRALPEAPETYYLMELLASHDFQSALRNYLDLEDLRARLDRWLGGFDAFEELVAVRQNYFEPRLPEVDQSFRELDSRIRLRREQYTLLQERLQDLLIAPRPDFLATDEEREMAEAIARIETALEADPSPSAEIQRERVARLKGALHYTLATEYHDRLTRFNANLRELQGAIDTMQAQYDSFVRARQAAEHSYQGYTAPIRRLRTRVAETYAQVELLMARQGHALELVAVDELLARRARLNNYRDQARYALADSFDRATESQSEVPAAGLPASELSLGVAGVGE